MGRQYTWFNEHGHLKSRKLTSYETHLEDEVQKLQDALFSISSHYAKIQFRLRQIACASGNERLCLLRELQRITCQGIDSSRHNDDLPTLMSDAYSMGDVRVRQQKILSQLRSRLTDLSEICDSRFSFESESSYNLRKYERVDGTTTTNGDLTSDGTVQHGKYCACIMCREEFCKETACKRGYLAETWPKRSCNDDEHFECKIEQSRNQNQRKRTKSESQANWIKQHLENLPSAAVLITIIDCPSMKMHRVQEADRMLFMRRPVEALILCQIISEQVT